MEKVKTNTIMLIMIFSLSCLIFIFTYTAYLLPKYVKEKDVDYFSDNYVVLSYHNNANTIHQIMSYSPPDLIKDIVFLFDFSNIKAINFSKDYFKKIGVNTDEVQSFKNDEDVALVNENHMNMCYEKEGVKYIFLQGTRYRVVGFFEESTYLPQYETYCYINVYGKITQSLTAYSCVLYDTDNAEDSTELVAYLKEIFRNATVQKWNGHRFNLDDVSSIYIFVILICGFVVGFNCIGFTESWIASQRTEIGVRRMIGETKFQINLWLLKNYLLTTVAACVLGTVMSGILMLLLREFEYLVIRELFGIELHLLPVCLSWITVGVIGLVTIEFYYIYRVNKKMLSNVRA